ncbi:MFS transporter [Propionispora vibrioides]|uniref:MFS transporter n=1 Tax=Propionispora vibrioides TaxID=112903 RepID=UPI000B8957A5|nr:MFS transporter [Propionispora vibrioides]
MGYFAITFLLTIYLQGTLQLSPLQSGLLIILLSVPQLIMGPLGGILADRFGAVRMMLAGLILLTLSLYTLGNLGIYLSVVSIITPLIFISVANGIALPSLAKTVLSSVPPEHAGAAFGMFYTIYNVGRSLSQPSAMAVMQFTISSDII